MGLEPVRARLKSLVARSRAAGGREDVLGGSLEGDVVVVGMGRNEGLDGWEEAIVGGALGDR